MPLPYKTVLSKCNYLFVFYNHHAYNLFELIIRIVESTYSAGYYFLLHLQSMQEALIIRNYDPTVIIRILQSLNAGHFLVLICLEFRYC